MIDPAAGHGFRTDCDTEVILKTTPKRAGAGQRIQAPALDRPTGLALDERLHEERKELRGEKRLDARGVLQDTGAIWCTGFSCSKRRPGLEVV